MKMHFCTAKINLAGQGLHIVNILATEPMSWPELQVMMAMHHEENVFAIKPIATIETTPTEEKRRLMAKYRGQQRLIEQVFPGRSPQMELCVPGELDNQPLADEFGIVVTQPNDMIVNEDDEPLGSREPPTGPAVFKPRRSFPGIEPGAT